MGITQRVSATFSDVGAQPTRAKLHAGSAMVGDLCTAEDDDAPSIGAVMMTLAVAVSALWFTGAGVVSLFA